MSATCGLLLAAVVHSAWAGVALDRTRLIITGNVCPSERQFNQHQSLNAFPQSWVEDASGAKVTSPPHGTPHSALTVGKRESPGSPKPAGLPPFRRIVKVCSISTCAKFRRNRINPTFCSWRCSRASSCFIALRRLCRQNRGQSGKTSWSSTKTAASGR